MYTNSNSTYEATEIKLRARRRKREQTVKILKIVAVGVLLVGIGAIPPPWMIPRIIRELTGKDTPENRKRTRRRFYDLERNGYISADTQRYEVAEHGKKVLKEMELWDLVVPTPKQWAGTWHLVVFDIPAKKSRVRIPFIRHLQSLGLQFYQRSVWIYPHPMRDAVQKIAHFYAITPYISFIIATDINGSTSLKRRFNLT